MTGVQGSRRHMTTTALSREQPGAGWLLQAVVRGDRSAVESVLLAGVSPDAQDEDGDTPLLLAAATGRTGIAELLLDAGADANLVGRDGITPLMMASLSGHHAVAALVLARAGPAWTPATRWGGQRSGLQRWRAISSLPVACGLRRPILW